MPRRFLAQGRPPPVGVEQPRRPPPLPLQDEAARLLLPLLAAVVVAVKVVVGAGSRCKACRS